MGQTESKKPKKPLEPLLNSTWFSFTYVWSVLFVDASFDSEFVVKLTLTILDQMTPTLPVDPEIKTAAERSLCRGIAAYDSRAPENYGRGFGCLGSVHYFLIVDKSKGMIKIGRVHVRLLASHVFCLDLNKSSDLEIVSKNFALYHSVRNTPEIQQIMLESAIILKQFDEAAAAEAAATAAEKAAAAEAAATAAEKAAVAAAAETAAATAAEAAKKPTAFLTKPVKLGNEQRCKYIICDASSFSIN